MRAANTLRRVCVILGIAAVLMLAALADAQATDKRGNPLKEPTSIGGLKNQRNEPLRSPKVDYDAECREAVEFLERVCHPRDIRDYYRDLCV